MHIKFGSSCLIAAGLFLAAPSTGQDAEEDPAVTALKEKKAKLELERDIAKLQNEAAAENFKLLEPLLTKGKAEIVANAGDMEASILAARAMNDVAARISERVKGKTIYIVPSGQQLKVGNLILMTAALQRHRLAMEKALSAVSQCATQVKPAVPSPTDPGGAVPGLASALSTLSGFLQSDIKLQPAAVTADSDMLARAIAGRLAKMQESVRLHGIIMIPKLIDDAQNSELNSQLSQSETVRKLLQLCIDKVKPKAGATGPDPSKPLTVVGAAFDEYVTSISQATEAGNIPLVDALTESMALSANAHILRVKVEKAGGTVMTTKNLWTMLGADMVKISGGLIISYDLSDPMTGNLTDAGIYACAVGFHNIRQIQSHRGRKPNCKGSFEEQPPTPFVPPHRHKASDIDKEKPDGHTNGTDGK